MSQVIAAPPRPTSSGVMTFANPAFTNFNNVDAFYHIGNPLVTKTVSASGMLLQNISLTAKTYFAGVATRGRIFPDQTDGELTLELTFDNAVRPTDVVDNDNVGLFFGTFLPGNGVLVMRNVSGGYEINLGYGTSSGDTWSSVGAYPNATLISAPGDNLVRLKYRYDTGGAYGKYAIDGAQIINAVAGNPFGADPVANVNRSSIGCQAYAGLRIGIGFLGAGKSSAVMQANIKKFEIVKGIWSQLA